ncbi:MAG: hypothetical protein DHS20C15_27350 [Planctomycetota bacterium]|nr:MAG: hypothetical protein DHS20C15_27350 [Planctomycetota bacterium]
MISSPFTVARHVALAVTLLASTTTAAIVSTSSNATDPAGMAQAPALLGTPLADPLPDIPNSDLTVRLAPVVTGLTFPTDAAVPPDGSPRLFLTQLNGLVHVLQEGVLQATPFLDFSADHIMTNGSATSSVTFHPDFATNRKLYVVMTENKDPALADFGSSSGIVQQSVLYEVAAQANYPAPGCNLIDLAATRELFRINELNFIHNLGDLEFGSDGYLYMTKGDDRNGGQNLTTIHGTVLRIDVDFGPGNALSANGNYAIPHDNPFVSGTSGELGEIWAYGFRNPWRLSIDGSDVWVADIGEGDIEEVNLVPAGGNYGWSAKEGSFAYLPGVGVTDDLSGLPAGPFVDPIGEYDHGQGDRSLTGGVIYRGARFPDLVGDYVFGEWISGRVFHMDTNTGAIERLLVDPLGETIHGQNDGAPKEGILSITTDADGELLLVVTEREFTPTARVLRVEPANWLDLGNGLAGATGEPTLIGGGSLSAGKPSGLLLKGAAPLTPTTIVWGAAELGLPFKGGVMVPTLDILVHSVSTNGAGALQVGGPWPAGIPAGLHAYFQVWVHDVTGPAGFAASNAVRGTTN